MLTQAKLGKSTKISPTAVIGENVEIGDNTEIREFVVIRDNVKIGANNIIHPHVTIGEEPQDRSFQGEKSFVEIGDNNVLRENVSIHRPVGLDQVTKLGNDNYLMVGVHLAHNTQVADGNTFANNTCLAGYVEVGSYATFGGGVMIHQHCRVGDYAMLSGLTAANKDVPPYMTVGGIPAQAITTNRYGLKKHNFSQEDRADLMLAFRLIYDSGFSASSIVEELEKKQSSPMIKNLANFIKASKRGIISQKFKTF